MNLDAAELDRLASSRRDALLVEWLRRQLVFVRTHVPFWRDRLEHAGVIEDHIHNLADLARIPIFSKAELRATRPASLLPSSAIGSPHVGRWTSGTSGRPTVNFWSRTDWAALVASTGRMLARHSPVQAPVVFNGYSQGHLTGPLYDAALRRVGATVYDRSHHPEEFFSTLAQMDLFDFDTLILPARATRGKGVGLADLLQEDSSLLSRHGVRWWIGSSGTFDEPTVQRARAQGVKSISNLYGSSEFGIFAVSCAKIPGDFHVAQGHVLVEVIDESGSPVQNGGQGRIVVTHLCGMEDDGQARPHTGTQILRLAIGDAGTLLTETCECGLTTPRLRDIQRLPIADQ